MSNGNNKLSNMHVIFFSETIENLLYTIHFHTDKAATIELYIYMHIQ